ncbi:MAG: hypothetical protein AAF589_03320 [Planctomycetota bacterium]
MTDPKSTQTAANDESRPDGMLDAAAILEVANGQRSLRRTQNVGTSPRLADARPLPPAEKPEGSYASRQPHKRLFDAADIYELSLAAHPWQAAPIKKTAEPQMETPANKAG